MLSLPKTSLIALGGMAAWRASTCPTRLTQSLSSTGFGRPRLAAARTIASPYRTEICSSSSTRRCSTTWRTGSSRSGCSTTRSSRTRSAYRPSRCRTTAIMLPSAAISAHTMCTKTGPAHSRAPPWSSPPIRTPASGSMTSPIPSGRSKSAPAFRPPRRNLSIPAPTGQSYFTRPMFSSTRTASATAPIGAVPGSTSWSISVDGRRRRANPASAPSLTRSLRVDWRIPYPSIRQPILAANCVATSQPLAAQAGLAMLAKGGNAVDAAIATAVALTVVEPVMNGIGSDAFAIVASGGQLIGLNASGRSPAGWTAARFAKAPSVPATGWDSAPVPGAVSAWVALHKRFGRLPFETLFEPAIGYARRGFLVSPVVAQIWLRQVALGAYPEFARVFLLEGRAPAAGEVFRCPDHANTLEAIAASDGQAFYRGAIAEAIAAAAKREGGAMTLADLAEHELEWVTPLGVDFHGVSIHQLPPNGQGLAALIALGVLDRCDLEGLDADSAELQHLAIEATKLGIADAAAHVADPAAMRVEAETLLADGYLRERATLIRRDRAQAPDPGKPPQGGTVYLAAADA